MAFFISGLFYGPLSESWSRRGLMLAGATLFLLGALGCVFSYSIHQLIFWQFIQGLGASGAVILGFTMISDKYNSDTATNYIGKINAYVTIFMASAPILGSVIINYFTWRMNFTAVACIALISWILLITQLTETNPNTRALKFKEILKDYWHISRHGKFMTYAIMPNMLVTAYLTFVGSASFYYINTCKFSYFKYGIHQGLIVLSFSVMSFYAQKVVTKIGEKKAVQLGMMACGISTAFVILFAFLFPFTPVLITAAMCLFAIGCAFPMSVTFAKSMEILPTLKGACASMIVASRLLISSLAIALTGVFFDGSMRPVTLVNGLAVGIALLLYSTLRKSQQNPN